MATKVKISITDEQGVVLDRFKLSLDENLTVTHNQLANRIRERLENWIPAHIEDED